MADTDMNEAVAPTSRKALPWVYERRLNGALGPGIGRIDG